MLGPAGVEISSMSEEGKGFMPRALRDLFAGLTAPGAYDSWSMAVTYIETHHQTPIGANVYRDRIRDLLAPPAKFTGPPYIEVYEMDGLMHMDGVPPTPVVSLQVCLLSLG